MSRAYRADTDQADTDQADAAQADTDQADAAQADADQADTGPAGQERGNGAVDLAVWQGLLSAHDRVSKLIESNLWHKYALAPRQLALMRLVAEAPGKRLRLAALTDRMGLSTTDVSRLCLVLEKRELLARRRTAQSTVLTLTGTGSAVTRRALDTQLDCIRMHLLPRLSPQDVITLAALLTRINQP